MIRPVDDEGRDPLALLAAAAGDAPAPAGDPLVLDEMVRVALVASAARRSRRTRVQTTLAMAAAAVLALGTGAWLGASWATQPSSSPATPEAPAMEIARMVLPTGDRIVRLGHGDLAIERLDPEERRLEVGSGHVLFDVAPLGPRERFEVRTPHLVASVVGTVFALDVDDSATRVAVFDGVVRVTWSSDGHVELIRGQTFDSRTGTEATGWTSPLRDEGLAAGRRHASRRRAREVGEAEVVAEPIATATVAHRTVAADDARTEEPASLERARTWLAEGEIDLALTAAVAACERAPTHGGWQLLRADALRAQRQWAPSVAAYETAAANLPPSRATSAGYLAAYVRLSELGDAPGALATLERTGALRDGSPIEERATVLRIRALIASGDRDAAEEAGRRYLLRFPAGASRDWVSSLLDP